MDVGDFGFYCIQWLIPVSPVEPEESVEAGGGWWRKVEEGGGKRKGGCASLFNSLQTFSVKEPTIDFIYRIKLRIVLKKFHPMILEKFFFFGLNFCL